MYIYDNMNDTLSTSISTLSSISSGAVGAFNQILGTAQSTKLSVGLCTRYLLALLGAVQIWGLGVLWNEISFSWPKQTPEQAVGVLKDLALTSDNLRYDISEVLHIGATQDSHHIREQKIGIPNPVKPGQSFDCHDHSDLSSGALYTDIQPAIDVLKAFPKDSDCAAFGKGCYLVACSGTAGIFLCNWMSVPITVATSELIKIAQEVQTNYISRHEDQTTELDFCRRIVRIENVMTGPKGHRYTGNSFLKPGFPGDFGWSLQINMTERCYKTQEAPRMFGDGLIELGKWEQWDNTSGGE
ncbi:hypothetical protein ABW19_dt0201655 [Dactylella cylindrospora]|nr:hypothetical protein ABW19_dt0201655 [Dactylella cylindrospora]